MAHKRVNKSNFDNKSHMQMAGLALSGFALAVIGVWLTFGTSAASQNLLISGNDILAQQAPRGVVSSGAKKDLPKWTMDSNKLTKLSINNAGKIRLKDWYYRNLNKRARLCVFADQVKGTQYGNEAIMILEFSYGGIVPQFSPKSVINEIFVLPESDFRKYCTKDTFLLTKYPSTDALTHRAPELYFIVHKSAVVDVTGFIFEIV